MPEVLYQVSVWLLPVLIAITFHEAAHGYVAWRLGDDTAKNEGRVTFQPLRHVDKWGTLIIPGSLLLMGVPFIFGWAKPVPVNFMRLNNPRRDMVWVAAAGPGINIILALASGFLLHLAGLFQAPGNVWVVENLVNSIKVNLLLAVLNMLPIPPLDGGRVAVGMLPRVLAMQLARLERIGIYIVIFFLIVLPYVGKEFGLNLNFLGWFIGSSVKTLFQFILVATGHL
jgi:Zn-dependent protease